MNSTNGFDIELSEEQRMVRTMAREFATDKVAPLAMKIDQEHYFPEELIPLLRDLGFLSVFIPEEYGGAGLDYVSYLNVVEELSCACASTGVIVSAHNSLAVWPILHFGSDSQKEKYLPLLASKGLGCFALSEPGTGSDAARLTCRAEKVDNGWKINGVKNWITNAPDSAVCVLLAMEHPDKLHKGINCYIVDLAVEGVSIGKKEHKLGICGSSTASITFDDVVLPDDALLGIPGQGFEIAMSTLDGGRIGIAAQAIGIARSALEESIVYSKQRETFGKPICRHQSIQNYLAEMSCRIDASRLMALHASKRKQAGIEYGREAAQAKLFASETSVAAALLAIQIHGGYGYVKEFPVERLLRDAKITEIYEGTSEIQKLVIAGHLLKE